FVAVEPQPQIQSQVFERDLVLRINILLIDVRAPMKLKRTSSTGQVDWDQSDRYSGIGQVPRSSAGGRIENTRRDDRIATGIYADGIEQRIRYAQSEVLDQAS